MKCNVLEFDSDIKNRIFYALCIYIYIYIVYIYIYMNKIYNFILNKLYIYNFTYVAALLFFLSLHIAVCTLMFA